MRPSEWARGEERVSRRRWLISLVAIPLAALAVAFVQLRGFDGHAEDAVAELEGRRPRNRLASEASPYLQLHAENPVDWYPWGDEALERARIEQRPIFLSIGYSTCYWCHVMEREVFSNPEIAALMNEHFVSIKVDREERPDIDQIYMTATQMLTGSGGWPNSVFLTPAGKPFYAGTYFPPQDSPGRPGFPKVLRSLHEAWTNQREKVEATAAQVEAQLARVSSSGSAPSAPPPTSEAISGALRALHERFDAEHGGFGAGMKFPRAPVLDLLLSKLERERDPLTEEMLLRTLDEMALGGVYDQLGGGFHRYSVERTWSLPHFEKMLYDNAQLVGIYARAFALTHRPLYRRVVEQTVAWLEREMSHPEGGFYSAQDAEVDGKEGAPYAWSREELADVLGVEGTDAFLESYELAAMPHDPGRGVLRLRASLSEQLKNASDSEADALLARFDDAREALLARRALRTQPRRDDKVLAAWNGLAIRGLVEAGRALERADYIARAERAARFLLARLGGAGGSLQRSYVAGRAREQAVLDDYASVADGLLALHRATGDEHWREASERQADVLLARFEDPEAGGFFLTPSDSTLLIRPKPFDDNEAPSGNAQALRVLQVLAAQPAGERYAKSAKRTAAAAGALLRASPDAAPATVAALSREPELLRVERSSTDGAARASRFPRSADHVRVALERSNDAGEKFALRVSVDPGWHLNANPASLAYLVATEVKLADAPSAKLIRYPKGRSFRSEFSEDALDVYEGTFEIEIEFAEALRGETRLTLDFQACDATRCLPPDHEQLVIGE